MKLSKNPMSLKACEEGCRILNRYCTPLKYPSHYPTATKEQAAQGVELANQIKKIIRREIGIQEEN